MFSRIKEEDLLSEWMLKYENKESIKMMEHIAEWTLFKIM